MRMRKRHNLDARMAKCAELLIDAPQELRGLWKDKFDCTDGLLLELGCGKGRFTVDTAQTERGAMLVALEKVPDAMIIAMERTAARGLDNIRFINSDAAKLKDMFADGELDRLYINFCDPWPKSRDAKFRLTSPFFLRIYCDLLPVGGEIWFKTDNTPLFDWSIEQFESEGWELRELTHDLHGAGLVGVLTDYEAKFLESGMKINRLVARRVNATKGSAAGAVPRIRNAALTDARGYDESVSAGRDGE